MLSLCPILTRFQNFARFQRILDARVYRMRIDVSNMARSIYRSRMDTTRCTNPVIVDWYLTREKWEFGESEKKKKKYDEVNDRRERVREKLTNWEHDWERHIRNWIISQFDLKDLVLSASIRVSVFLPMKFRHSSRSEGGMLPWPKTISLRFPLDYYHHELW